MARGSSSTAVERRPAAVLGICSLGLDSDGWTDQLQMPRPTGPDDISCSVVLDSRGGYSVSDLIAQRTTDLLTVRSLTPENETELSFFNRAAYEEFKAHPEVGPCSWNSGVLSSDSLGASLTRRPSGTRFVCILGLCVCTCAGAEEARSMRTRARTRGYGSLVQTPD